MCRKNELVGSMLMACGAGMLLAMLFQSQFALALVGMGFLVGGLFFARRD